MVIVDRLRTFLPQAAHSIPTKNENTHEFRCKTGAIIAHKADWGSDLASSGQLQSHSPSGRASRVQYVVGIVTLQNRIKARNPLTNSSSPLTKGTKNVTTKTELGRQLAFAGIHLIFMFFIIRLIRIIFLLHYIMVYFLFYNIACDIVIYFLCFDC